MYDLVENTELAKEKKSKAVKEIFHTLEKKDKEFEEEINPIVSEALSDIQVATQKDIKELNKHIDDLEKNLQLIQMEMNKLIRKYQIEDGSKKYEKKYSQAL